MRLIQILLNPYLNSKMFESVLESCKSNRQEWLNLINYDLTWLGYTSQQKSYQLLSGLSNEEYRWVTVKIVLQTWLSTPRRSKSGVRKQLVTWHPCSTKGSFPVPMPQSFYKVIMTMKAKFYYSYTCLGFWICLLFLVQRLWESGWSHCGLALG